MVLSRYSNEKDVTYGILTTGRSTASAGIEHMRGHTINILPIRIKIPTDTLFLDWLKQLMEMQLEWVRHEYTPIDKIYEYLGLTPEQPLFDNFVVIQNLIRITAKKNPLYGPDSYYSLYHAKMEYPLRLDVDPTLNIGLVFHYYRQCISDVVVKGLQENMKILLESIANKPQQTIGELMQLINPENIRLEKEQIKPMVL
jgi:non-ribosomal peptide synthetase component F